MVNATLSPLGLRINETAFAEAPSLGSILSAFGKPACRERELCDQGKPWRKFVILDQIGIYMLYDFEIQRVIDINFSFVASKSPASPAKVFSGLLFVNSSRLVAGMKERLLPITGEFHFLKRGGWEAKSEAVFVNIRVLPRNKQMEAVAVSFLKRPRFACEE